MSPEIPSVSDADFDERVLRATTPVLVDFWADGCGPCRQLLPVLASLQADLGERVEIVKAKVDECPQAVAGHEIAGTPTTILFRDGVPVYRLHGARPKARIRAEIDKHL